MAARRLIAILLVLLFLSSLATALAPVDRGSESSSTTSSSEPSSTSAATGEPGETGPGAQGGLIRQSIDTSARRAPTIAASVGDQLQLRVTSRRPGTVELSGIGPTEDVGPRQPAFFDVLLREEGPYEVQFLETERQIARIEVAGPGLEAPPR